MKARKILAALGAALMMIGVSAPASAFECEGNGNLYDQVTISDNLIELAKDLRCLVDTSPANEGRWDMKPIWEKRAAPSCEVHMRLARHLDEAREFKIGTKPRKNQNNDSAGAGGDVRNGKFEGALSKLDSFLNDAMKARLNRDFDGGFDNAAIARGWFTTEVKEARDCVNHFLL